MSGLVVITGGSRGIGAATARLAARHGWDVWVGFHHDEAAASRVVADCRRQGVRSGAVRLDVSVEAEVAQLFAAAESESGPMRALVNNAGIVARQSRLEDLDPARIRRVMEVNVVGPFLCAREAVRRMARSRGGAGGSIVNVSSRAAVLGSANEYVDYAASKAALDAMTIGLARETAADGIRVNSVRPGLIETDIHTLGGEPGRMERLRTTVPMQRVGQPEEVAEAILWLLSPQASYVTGAVLDVSGGR